MKKQFKFSVIIPIYNVEDYLEETIESVINQTIGFKDNIELILINDGSPDNSEEICLKYKELYPENIVYYKQKNAGVSAARNKGIELATGELINFLDSDDKWSLNALKAIAKAYKKHPNVKVYSTKMEYFDAKKGNHILNYKYKKNKIIDIREDCEYIQLSTCSCVIANEILKNYKYDLSIKNEEDTKLINEILLDCYKMMVLRKPTYYYRRRANQSSASQNSSNNKPWYTITPHEVYEYLFSKSQKQFGKILDYFKYLVAYDIAWRINIPTNNKILSKQEQEDYINCITKLIKLIDIDMFARQKNITPTNLIYINKIKNSNTEKSYIKIENNDIKCTLLSPPDDRTRFINVDDIYIKGNILYLVCKVNLNIYNKEKIEFFENNKTKKIEYYKLHSDSDDISYNNENITNYLGLKVELDITKVKSFGFKYNNSKDYISLTFSSQCNLTNLLKGSYYTFKDKIVTYENGEFIINKKTIFKCLNREIKNLIGLLFSKKKIKQLLIRIAIIITRPFAPKNIWLLSDRVNVADDNAEHLFKYINENHKKDVNAYYVISKYCADYERMKQYGKVIDNTSLKYKFLFANADYIISSHAETYITNLFGKNNQYYKDLFKFKYVFLQHGITKDDISSWLNPNTKHIDMFVSAVQKEYESLCKYGYNKEVIQMTGFPRYDGLINKQKQYKPKNTIMVSFTWRSNLANKIDYKSGQRLYNENFKESDYFKWINNFLSDEKVHKILKEYGYKINFIPHPNVMPQINDFKPNEFINIKSGSINYQKEFCENKLLITDNSSIFFDFAYLRKPVIYYQPDLKDFYSGQIYNKGYFDFEKMGFGPIFEDYNEFIDYLTKIIKNDCELEKKYEKRIDEFFTYNDANNCERVYDKIVELKKGE